MRPHWIIGSVGIFIIGTMFACIASGRWLVNGEVNIINALASFNVVGVQEDWGLAKSTISVFNAIVTALSWDYPFLDDPWAIFVKVPLWLVSIGTIWSLLEMGTAAVNGILGVIKGIVS
jgi:hypothetical protein